MKVFARVLKKRHPGKASFYLFSLKKLIQLFILKEVKPSPDRKMIIKLLAVITCSRYYDILAKSRCRMTTAITFPRQTTLVHARALLSVEKISYS